MGDHPVPREITLHSESRVLSIAFDDGFCFDYPCEYLRVYSPSAEVRARRGEDSILVAGKRLVNIETVEPVGNYAVKLRFDDGHNTGIYDWRYLYQLGREQELNWARYLKRLEKAGLAR